MVPLVVLCCFVFIGSQPAPAQYNKLDPGTNNPPPAGAIKDLSGTPIPGGGNSTYQQYTVNFAAGIPNTAITFAIREDPAFISLSNVSVTDMTTPSGELLANGNFSGGTYANTQNSAIPNGWTYANQYGAFAGGFVVSGCGVGGGSCWYDGAVQAYDAISQTIATIVGHTYQISFFVADNSGCRTEPVGAPCNFSDLSTNGNTAGTGGNGINVTVYAQAGLPPAGSATQMQTTPPQNFNTTTDTTVPIPFNSAPFQQVQLDVVFPGSSDPLIFPIGPPVQFQGTNRFVANPHPYTGGTAFATAIPFDHAGNDAMAGSAGNGAKYEVICYDATHPPSEANCPFPSPGTHIRAKDSFDLPRDAMGNFIQPVIAPGTTVEMIHWYPNLGGANSTSWSGSSTIPHPACPNMFMPNFACDLEGILVNKYGKSNGFGSDTKKGDYLLVTNVPMPCSAWKVNGVPVNTPCVQNQDSSVFFVHSPLNFIFDVTPAQCPAAQSPCGNGWMAAPIAEVFSTFDPVGSAPDLPGMLIDLTDTNPPNCPGPGMDTTTNCPVPNGLSCPGTNCAVTSANQPGAGPPAAPVEFTSTAMPEPEGQFELQVSTGDTVRIRERNVQLLTSGPCPNPFPNVETTATAPCYSTTLFNGKITVDNTKPTISSGPTLSAPGSPMVTVTYTCSDTGSPVPADNSGIAICGATPPGTMHNIHGLGGPGAGPSSVTEVDTLPSAIGSYSFTVQATDVAGNVSQPSQVNYTVYGICALYDQTKAVHSGATIPVKMYLGNCGTDLSSSSIVVHATGLFQMSSLTSDPVVDDGNANPDMDFRFDSTLGPSGGYIFNLKTSGLGTGNWVIQFTVAGDPTLHSLGFGVK
jgi:hypothetical protein